MKAKTFDEIPGQVLGGEALRGQIDHDVLALQSLGRLAPDSAYAMRFQLDPAVSQRVHPPQKIFDAVHAGEYQPVVPAQMDQRAVELLPTRRLFDFDRRARDDLGAEGLQGARHLAALFGGPRDDDATSEERTRRIAVFGFGGELAF